MRERTIRRIAEYLAMKDISKSREAYCNGDVSIPASYHEEMFEHVQRIRRRWNKCSGLSVREINNTIEATACNEIFCLIDKEIKAIKQELLGLVRYVSN